MATYAGVGFGQRSEYLEAYETRMQYDEITRGELYVARFELPPYDTMYRILGRVGMMMTGEDSRNVLKFQMLDDDMRPVDVTNVGYMDDGLWVPFKPAYVRPAECPNGVALRNGCLGEYDEGEGRGLNAEIQLLLDRELDMRLTSMSHALAQQS